MFGCYVTFIADDVLVLRHFIADDILVSRHFIADDCLELRHFIADDKNDSLKYTLSLLRYIAVTLIVSPISNRDVGYYMTISRKHLKLIKEI